PTTNPHTNPHIQMLITRNALTKSTLMLANLQLIPTLNTHFKQSNPHPTLITNPTLISLSNPLSSINYYYSLLNPLSQLTERRATSPFLVNSKNLHPADRNSFALVDIKAGRTEGPEQKPPFLIQRSCRLP
ncbi:MAG: hypothetical protein ACREHG_02035, partial [Candidatus Saccharimonadales bacterium]